MDFLTIKEAIINFYFYITGTFIPIAYDRLYKLITAPLNHEEMVWIVVPLVITTILMRFYFGRYTREKLGWNTAVGNSLVLFFVSLDLLRYINQGNLSTILSNFAELPLQSLIAFYVGIVGFAMFFFDFFHILPKKLAFFLGNSLVINLTAYIAIVLIYTNPIGKEPSLYSVPLDPYTVVAAFILFWLLWLLFWLVTLFEPKKVEREMLDISGVKFDSKDDGLDI